VSGVEDASVKKTLAGKRFWVCVRLLARIAGSHNHTKRTFWIKLEDLNVAVGICDHDIKLLSVWQEICSNDFELIRVLAKKSQLVRLLLDWHPVSIPRESKLYRPGFHTE